MLKFIRHSDQGDTLIEVLFAIAAFSLIAISSLAIMNQGANTAQRSLEITLVRQQLDAQAETLRYLNSSYVTVFRPGVAYGSATPAAQWSDILNSGLVTNVSNFPDTSCPSKPIPSSFILNTHTATFVPLNNTNGIFTPATTFSQVIYNGDQIKSDGVWIEAKRYTTTGYPNQANADYIDFYIRACWSSPGESTPATLGTIVRLYEPT
jgi:type II secretory pathway pseudopilin PulG